ncbi:MAG: aminotransferase class IV [Synechococcus sp.]|nr:aminotransferase class IV [Synechococcus sp.]
MSGDSGPPSSHRIAWIGEGAGGAAAQADCGRWGSPEDLCLPLADRGLLLADGLFETVLVGRGRPRLLGPHLRRWRESAGLLGMALPPAAEALEPLLQEAIVRAGLAVEGCGALRLNWSRGTGTGRGLELPAEGSPETPPHRFWLQLTPMVPAFTPVRVLVSRWERRNATSRLSRCKTFAYGPSIQARREARRASCDDALLLSTAGGLCCGTAANLLVRRGERWLTPPLASGCLPGVMRQRALEAGLAEEADLPLEDLLAASTGARTGGTAALLLNSLGCRPLAEVEGQALPASALEAQQLWRSLLD